MHRPQRSIILLAAIALCLSYFSACGRQQPVAESATGLPQPATGAPQLPTAQLTSPPPAFSSETPGLEIRAARWIQDAQGRLLLMGIVHNGTRGALTAVEIEIELLDAQGTLIYADTVGTLLQTVPPGASAPYRMAFAEDAPGWHHLAATVRGTPVDPDQTAETQPLKLARQRRVEDRPNELGLVLEARNESDVPLQQPQAVITVYDADGQLIGLTSTPAMQDLVMAGALASFHTRIPLAAGAAARHTVQLAGRAAPESLEHPPSLETASRPRPVPDANAACYLLEIANRSDEPVTSLRAVLTANGAQDQLLGTARGSALLDTLPPGARSPAKVCFRNQDITAADTLSCTVEGRYATSDEREASHQQLEIVRESGQQLDQGRYRLTAEIRNAGQRTANAVQVVATAYGVDGALIGVASAHLSGGSLAPGEQASIETTILVQGDVAEHRIQAQARAR